MARCAARTLPHPNEPLTANLAGDVALNPCAVLVCMVCLNAAVHLHPPLLCPVCQVGGYLEEYQVKGAEGRTGRTATGEGERLATPRSVGPRATHACMPLATTPRARRTSPSSPSAARGTRPHTQASLECMAATCSPPVRVYLAGKPARWAPLGRLSKHTAMHVS